jgi:hypothetical protein
VRLLAVCCFQKQPQCFPSALLSSPEPDLGQASFFFFFFLAAYIIPLFVETLVSM